MIHSTATWKLYLRRPHRSVNLWTQAQFIFWTVGILLKQEEGGTSELNGGNTSVPGTNFGKNSYNQKWKYSWLILYFKSLCELDIVVYAFNFSTWKAEAGGWFQGQPGVQIEFQDSWGYYTEKPCLKIKNKKFYFIWDVCACAHTCKNTFGGQKKVSDLWSWSHSQWAAWHRCWKSKESCG